MDENVGWLGRIVQYFGPMVAAWSAFLAYLVHLKKIRNAEKAATHGRLLAEIEHLTNERDVIGEERDLVRDRWAESERISNERLGRAVIAEATVVALNKQLERASILPGTTEPERPSGNGGGK